MSTNSPFASIESAPPDPILDIKQKVAADPNPNKVDLSVGVYQNDEGFTPNLDVVREAQTRLMIEHGAAGYLPIDGLPSYLEKVQRLLFGSTSDALRENRIVTVQSLGGSGALRYGADFIARHFPETTVYLSDPSWANHRPIFERARLPVKSYPYYNPETNTLEFEAMCDALRQIPERSVVLLHVSCHNPTGCDLSQEQWRDLVPILQRNGCIPFLDFAYQGFREGIEQDAWLLRFMEQQGLYFIVANSFSKNFSLYRRRTGALSIVTGHKRETDILRSQLKAEIRVNNSNPPIDGAAIVNLVLSDASLTSRWYEEVADMRERVIHIRARFLDALNAHGAGERFAHLRNQNGMFSFSGLSAEQVDRLEKEYSVYAVRNGRICVAAMLERNVDYIAEAVANVAG